MKKVELLAPAGNMESLKAAVSGGCNAVYLGLKSFSARAFAGNFSHEEFIEAIHYCHTRDVKVYVTINTMLFESEIEKAKKEVDFLYENDCDAILVQDLGLFHYIRTCYPDFSVHCSTQMHIHNIKGVEYMKQEGASRVVLARETPIEIIQDACKTGVEIEVFVYGAICISYSGQCLLSESTKNRSANRGMCAQCCRLRYLDENDNAYKQGEYLLSPKDLNVINRLPELLDAGVASLKIEGRMKRPEYVYLVVKTFREAIDAYYKHQPYKVSNKRDEQLKLMFNRGFSEGHIFHSNVVERMSQYRPNHQGIQIGEVMNYKPGLVQMKLLKPLHQLDGLRIIHHPHDTGLQANKIYKNGLLVNQANSNDVVWVSCPDEKGIQKGQEVHKTTDVVLIEEIDKLINEDIKIPIQLEYKALIGKPLEVTFIDTKGNKATCYSDSICEKAKNAPLSEERIEKAITKTNEYPYYVQSISKELEDVFIPVSVMNEVRREALEMLDETRTFRNIKLGKKEYSFPISNPLYQGKHLIIDSSIKQSNQNNDIQVYGHSDSNHSILPVINENNTEMNTYTDSILSSVCDLNNQLIDCIAGMNMNISNSYALAYVLSKGVKAVIFSSEMNNDQIRETLDAFNNRYGFTPYTYRLVYGKRTVMYIKDRFINESIDTLKDLNDRIYKVNQTNTLTMIKEPETYVSSNPYCYGSYLILDKQGDEEIGESYEEISRRI